MDLLYIDYMLEKEWYTPRELAIILRVDRLTVIRMEKRGSLLPTKRVQVGRRSDRLYSRKDILEYLGEPTS